jgi:CarboxypepD_reg-like domain/TonB-dependent Receptor Plug Domain
MFNTIKWRSGQNNFLKRKYFLSVIFLLTAYLSPAQTGIGKLTGKVTDGATNEPLAGVSITAAGKTGGITSITDGTYIFSLSAGTYTITFSYLGYQKKEITGVVIKAQQSTFLDMILQKSGNKLQDVVVTSSAKKESQSAVYSAQKRSAAASDGISLEAIRKTPDNNAGQILKRVTGVSVQDNRFVVVRGLGEQYNQTMMNGVPMTSTETNKNAFAFDLIPAAVIDNITINKTATPDMPGNFAGGIVQINTKDFPARDFFSIAVQGGYSDGTFGKDFYNDKRGNLEALTFSGSIRDLPKDFPSNTSKVQFTSLNLQEQYRYLRMLKNNLAPVNYGLSGPNENIQLGFGKTIQLKNESQLGIVVALNQRKTELTEQETQARDPSLTFNSQDLPRNRVDTLQGLGTVSNNIRYRYSSDFGGVLNIAYRFGNNKITLKNLYTRVFNNTFVDRDFTVFDNDAFNNFNKGITHFAEQRSILNNTLSGEHRTGKNNETRLDWNFNITSNRIYTPDLRNYILQGEPKLYKTSANVNLEQSLIGASRVWSENKDNIYGGAFNITTPFDLFKSKQLFKSGILFQNRTRKSTGVVLPITGAEGTLETMMSPEFYNPVRNTINIASSSLAGGAGNYDGGSSLLATYFSFENKIGKKTRVIWGIRAENYQQTVNVYKTQYFENIVEPEHVVIKFAARNTFNFLPSVNFVYSPMQSINIRAAYSNTVIRPELKDLAAFQRFDLVSFALTTGNSDLKSSSISNYDLKFEWFPSSGEILSFAAFYKKMQDPIEYAFTEAETVTSKIALNTGTAYVKGLEAEIRKKIDFIKFAPWLSHLTLFGNGAILSSKVAGKEFNTILLRSFNEHALTGQPKYILNAGFSILLMKETLEATLSFNKTGDHIYELGTGDLDVRLADGTKVPRRPHTYLQARNMMDVVLSKSILNNKGKFKFNITNLLNQRFLLYQDLNGNAHFDTPVTVTKVGDRSNNYLSGIDNVPLNITPQRTYSLSFTYTF